MVAKSQYKTKHREELISFLETVRGEHITVNDVCEIFRKNGKEIGTTTVYRQLEKMVDEGIVTKYVIDSKSPACFEYLGPNHGDSHEEEHCYHCKCEVCNALIHLHCDEFPELKRHVQEHHGFAIDPTRTVFYGVCSKCASSL